MTKSWQSRLDTWLEYSEGVGTKQLTRFANLDLHDTVTTVSIATTGSPEYTLGLVNTTTDAPVVYYPGSIEAGYDESGKLVGIAVPATSTATLHYHWIDPTVDTHVPAVIAQEDRWVPSRMKNASPDDGCWVRKGDVVREATTNPFAGSRSALVNLGK